MKFYDEILKGKFKPSVTNVKNLKISIPMSDKDGLAKAYSLPEKLFKHGKTLYVAGTSSLQDVWDDLKIPFHLTSQSQRYTDADKVMKQNHNIKTVVGHSLGGSVALELQNNYKGLASRTYGAPVLTMPWQKGGERYRNYLDPISFLDWGAENSLHVGNPHSFDNLAEDKKGLKE